MIKLVVFFDICLTLTKKQANGVCLKLHEKLNEKQKLKKKR